MLVFTRRRNEAIIVADGIEIRVLPVSKDAVRLERRAGRSDVPVHRQEVYDVARKLPRGSPSQAWPIALPQPVKPSEGAS